MPMPGIPSRLFGSLKSSKPKTSSEDLRDEVMKCFNREEFRNIVNLLASGDSNRKWDCIVKSNNTFPTNIMNVVDFYTRQKELDRLLSALRRANPAFPY